ncbi:hypothetical protein WG622_13095 [Cognatishimia sp. D5M38]|uniref:Uncharacterized protein n=1 Tax=Cognatishimia coralii TaxID=3083254 RepID=A0ABU8QIE5_9RHOB
MTAMQNPLRDRVHELQIFVSLVDQRLEQERSKPHPSLELIQRLEQGREDLIDTLSEAQAWSQHDSHSGPSAA